MDVTPFLEPKVAPRWVLDDLEPRRDVPRFMLPAAEGGWRPVTWGAFARQIRAVGQWLLDLGLEPGDRCAVLGHNRVEWLGAALGIQAAGGVMVPIYPASTADQIAYVVEHSDARVLFVDTESLGRCPVGGAGLLHIVLLDDALDLERGVVRWSEVMAHGAADSVTALDARLAAIDLDQPAVMLYTSGTTGLPKGVPLTHRNLGTNGRDWLTCNGPLLEEGYVDLLWLPMSHIFGFGEACLGNTLAFTSYLSDPRAVMTHLPEVAPHVFMSVPAYWQKIGTALPPEPDAARLAGVVGERLRFCLSGGAGLEPAVKERLHGHGLLVIEGYGLTECSPTLTLNRPDAFRFDTVGKPLPSVELRLADDGEIQARGAGVFAGYHKDEAATAEAFTADGWFRTGDLGRFTDDGFLQIIGRKKEILVTAGGKNVPPANIEQRFAGDPYVLHAVVYGDGKKYLTAGVWLDEVAVRAELERQGVPEPERARARAELVAARIAAVNETLARFEQIRKHRIMDRPLTVEGGLLTSTLKLRREKIYEAFGSELESLYAEPGNA